MDYRKIQVTGEGTYTVSLPKTWVKKNKLEKGDAISIVEQGDELSLRLKEEKDREYRVKVKTGDAEFLSRILITKYIQGYDSIVFCVEGHIDPSLREHLIKSSGYLIGLELFGETRGTITFRMLMKDGCDMLGSLERMHDLSILSLHELLDSLESGAYDPNVLSAIVRRDDEVDKFFFLILRQLSSWNGYESIIWAQVAKSIERISDHIETIAALAKEGRGVKNEDVKVFRQYADLYGDAMLTLKNGDLSLAEEILTKIQIIRAEGANLKNNLDGDNRKNILVYTSFRRIGEYISDLAESAINLS